MSLSSKRFTRISRLCPWGRVATAGLLAFTLLAWHDPDQARSVASAAESTLVGPIGVYIPRHDSGLYKVREDVQPIASHAVKEGIRVDVLGAYADAIRTDVFLRIQPTDANAALYTGGMFRVDTTRCRLRDACGTVLTPTFATAVQREATYATLEFAGLSACRGNADASDLTLEMQVLNWRERARTKASREIAGKWTFTWYQPVHAATWRLPQAASVSANGSVLRVRQIVVAPSATRITWSLTIPKTAQPALKTAAVKPWQRPPNVVESPKQPAYPQEWMSIENTKTGERFGVLHGSAIRQNGVALGDYLFPPLTRPGHYRLVVRNFNGVTGEWVFPFYVG